MTYVWISDNSQDLQWRVFLTMVPAGNKAIRLSSVNYTTIIIINIIIWRLFTLFLF